MKRHSDTCKLGFVLKHEADSSSCLEKKQMETGVGQLLELQKKVLLGSIVGPFGRVSDKEMGEPAVEGITDESMA